MKNENKLDNLFKERFTNKNRAENIGDRPDHLWEGISLRLDQMNIVDAKKRRLFFFTIGMIAASLIIGSVFINMNLDQDMDKENRDVDKQEIKKDDENYIASNANLESQEIILLEVVENNDIQESRRNSTFSKVKATSIKSNKSKKYDSYKIPITTLSNSSTKETTNQQINIKLNEEENLKQTSNLEDNQTSVVNSLSSSVGRIQSSQSYDLLNSFPKDGCLDYVDKPFNRMFLDVIGGTQMTDKLLYTENVAFQENVNERNRTESVTGAYSLGLRFTYMFDRGVSLKTGLLYSVINEQFRYVSAINTITVTDEEGNFIREYKEMEYATVSNKYSFFDIPVLISYNWSKKNVFAEFNSGFLVNVFAEQSGEFYNNEKERVSFDDAKVEPFKSFVGASLYTSGALGYSFPNNVSVFLEPHIRYHLKSISTKSYQIKQKYLNYGLYFGVRYQIK